MSTQINFFADETDSARLHSFLTELFAPLFIIKGDRGTYDELRPQLVHEPAMLHTFRKAFLVSEWALARVVYYDLGNVYPDQWVVDENESPVVEYSPSHVEEDGSLRIGRFYYTYRGKISKDYKRAIGAVFSWVRVHSVSFPGTASFRILDSAAKNAKLLRQWVGPPEPNPFVKGALA